MIFWPMICFMVIVDIYIYINIWSISHVNHFTCMISSDFHQLQICIINHSNFCSTHELFTLVPVSSGDLKQHDCPHLNQVFDSANVTAMFRLRSKRSNVTWVVWEVSEQRGVFCWIKWHTTSKPWNVDSAPYMRTNGTRASRWPDLKQGVSTRDTWNKLDGTKKNKQNPSAWFLMFSNSG